MTVEFGQAVLLNLVLIGALLSGCHSSASPKVAKHTASTQAIRPVDLSYVSSSDPVMDVHRAIRESRLQFLGMRDFAESVPGADHHPDLTSRLGVTYVQGSSDTADKAMQDAAWEYCQIYNGLLLRHLRSNGSANPPATGGTPTADSAKRSDPAADAQQAISRRDFRFLGIQKLGEYILGVQDRPDLTSRYGVIYLVGTRKFADADTEDAVREYCQTYNLLLVRYLRTAGRSDWSGASH